MNYTFRNILILFVVAVVILIGLNFWKAEKKLPYLDYSTFMAQLADKEITKVTIRGSSIEATDKFDRQFQTYAPDIGAIIPRLEAENVVITTTRPQGSSGFSFSPLILVLFMGGWMYFTMRQQKGGFNKGKNKIVPEERPNVTFADVAGIPEAKEELIETVECLKDSSKFTRLGGRIPKGVLLQGPPGTGKTLLAKAIAGEAGVPFYSMSGSDFVEMFVGVGASRVRNLFEQAKKNAPCIIFIDEIDAVGRSRGGAGGAQGGQDEREQTLNALLVEMDGFKSDETVIIVGATNRPDVLDPALMRPGRFDRQVTILPPDVKGREKILKVHAAKLKIGNDIDLASVAKNTPGFTGAELANLMNESALMAARINKSFIELSDIEEAKDKILMGAERKGMVINDQEKKVTAYHEAGHAIVAELLPDADPVHKITIIPRGRALGVTMQVPLDDRHAYNREYLRARIMTLLGGRTAEEVIFNQYTTGASNDLQTATEIATRMVCEWGMSDLLGPRAYVISDQSYLGGSSAKRSYSEQTAQAIDMEINKIIEECYQETMIIVEGKIAYLHKLAELLLENETIDAEEVNIILKCKEMSKLNDELLQKKRRDTQLM